MSTLRVNAIQNTSGVQQYLAQAFVNFNGTGTVAIRASGNVSSITDNGTGDYTVNFTNAMADANYTVVMSAQDVNNLSAQNLTDNFLQFQRISTAIQTSSVRIGFGKYQSNADALVCCVAIFR